MPSKMSYQLLIGSIMTCPLLCVLGIFVRFRVAISGTRSSRHERRSSAGCFRSRVLIRARRQRTRRAKHQNRYQLDSMPFHILNYHSLDYKVVL